MAIHEKTLIDAARLKTSDSLVVDGVDVSGHWNTMILPRTLVEYDDDFEKVIQNLPGGENVHRCWQCGSCTNSCTMYAQNIDFNPRYWIYLTRLGLKDELLKDKDIIWQCVSCNKCTNICPKDVRPEGVMKALAHWIEDFGYGDKSRARVFDEVFLEPCLERGRIEDTEIMHGFFKRTNQDMVGMVKGGWIGIAVARMNKWHELRNGNIGKFLSRMPLLHPLHMGLSMIFKPRTKSWARTGEVLRQFIKEQKELAHHG